jgi:hypothetical protein
MDIRPLAGRLVHDLDELYGGTPVAEVAACVDAVERHIADALREAVVASVEAAEPEMIARYPPYGFALEGVPYEVIVDYRDLLRDDTVGVLIAAVGGSDRPPKPARANCRIRGDGKYRKADIIVPPRFSAHLEALTELAQKTYESGYAWLSEFLQSKVRELESSMVVGLYRAVRLAFAGNQNLSQLVWLVLIQEDHGIYVFDQQATFNAVGSLAVQRGKARPSAVALFFGLLTSAVPFDQMFSRHAIPTGQCLHCDLAKSDYAGTEPLYTIAEHVLYRSTVNQSTVASIFPLSRDEQPYLIAAFPTSHEHEILPVLKDHLADIESVFSTHKERARTLFGKLRAVSRLPLPPPGKTGELLGGFFKGAAGY